MWFRFIAFTKEYKFSSVVGAYASLCDLGPTIAVIVVFVLVECLNTWCTTVHVAISFKISLFVVLLLIYAICNLNKSNNNIFKALVLLFKSRNSIYLHRA